MSDTLKVIVIGGIAAGMSVAAKAKRENPDAQITVIEKADYISLGACGLPYYLGGQFTDKNNMFARTPQQITDSGIELLLETEASNIDFNQQIVTIKDGKTGTTSTLPYDRLMIATGANPIQLAVPGADAPNVYQHTLLEDVDNLKANLDQYQNIAVIGGGFIGVEVADQLALLGKKVTIFQGTPTIMGGPFDPEFSELLQNALTEEGIDIRLNQMVAGFEVENGKVTGIVVADATAQTTSPAPTTTIKADAVIVAIGFKPNTAFINDPNLSKMTNGAIKINKFGETSIKNVFSAGDCASIPHRLLGDRYIPLATSANKMGRIIGTNIVNDEANFQAYPGSLGSSLIKAGKYEAGSTGLTETMATAHGNQYGMQYKTTIIKTPNHTNYYPEQSMLTIKLVYDAETKVVVGAQIFGKSGAALRLHALSVAIHAGISTDELGFIDLGYAPPFTTTWDAINIAANTAK